MVYSSGQWLLLNVIPVASCQWLPCSGSQWFSMVCNGYQWFSAVTSVSQWLLVVLNGFHAMVLN